MNLTRAMNATHVLLRIVAGYLFMQHGGQKLFGWFSGSGVTIARAVGALGTASRAAPHTAVDTRRHPAGIEHSSQD